LTVEVRNGEEEKPAAGERYMASGSLSTRSEQLSRSARNN
jgi:hypothetical protein